MPLDLEKNTSLSTQTDLPATFRRVIDIDNQRKVHHEEIEFHLQELKDLLIETAPRWKDRLYESDQTMTVEAPFHPFVWHWEKHMIACEPVEGDTSNMQLARSVLKALMQLLESSHALRLYFKNRDLLKSSKKITFEHLWTLYPHGSRVYVRSYPGELQMFEVLNSVELAQTTSFRITCCAFDWDGTQYQNYSYDFYIHSFPGEKTISSLLVFPLEFYCNEDGVYGDEQLQANLLKRGRKYAELCNPEQTSFQCEYQGQALVSPTAMHRLTSKGRSEDALLASSDPRQPILENEEVAITSIDMNGKHNRVIIDNFSFLKSARNPMKSGDKPPLGRRVPIFEPDCVCALCRVSTVQQWKPSQSSNFTEDDTRLRFLPPRLLGYALNQKVWGQFLVNRLTRVPSITNPETDNTDDAFWKELQLERESKELLMAFIKHHNVQENRTFEKMFDIIEGKGQGLVILLHGPPGVGKTLTAETIASATGRPLLTVSVAEIGVEAKVAERNLTDVFVDAARWEAVLLMDEADVFVEERVKSDLSRNALVSVLLRCLEYYQGMSHVVILTALKPRLLQIRHHHNDNKQSLVH